MALVLTHSGKNSEDGLTHCVSTQGPEEGGHKCIIARVVASRKQRLERHQSDKEQTRAALQSGVNSCWTVRGAGWTGAVTSFHHSILKTPRECNASSKGTPTHRQRLASTQRSHATLLKQRTTPAFPVAAPSSARALSGTVLRRKTVDSECNRRSTRDGLGLEKRVTAGK